MEAIKVLWYKIINLLTKPKTMQASLVLNQFVYFGWLSGGVKLVVRAESAEVADKVLPTLKLTVTQHPNTTVATWYGGQLKTDLPALFGPASPFVTDVPEGLTLSFCKQGCFANPTEYAYTAEYPLYWDELKLHKVINGCVHASWCKPDTKIVFELWANAHASSKVPAGIVGVYPLYSSLGPCTAARIHLMKSMCPPYGIAGVVYKRCASIGETLPPAGTPMLRAAYLLSGLTKTHDLELHTEDTDGEGGLSHYTNNGFRLPLSSRRKPDVDPCPAVSHDLAAVEPYASGEHTTLVLMFSDEFANVECQVRISAVKDL